MNKKIVIIGIIGTAIIVFILLLIVLAYIWFIKPTTTKNADGSSITQSQTIVTETLTYTDTNGIEYKLNKNKLTKTADISIAYTIADDVEYLDWFGTKATMAPFTINFTCAILNTAFFDPEQYQEAVKSFNKDATNTQPITSDTTFASKLEGYKISSFTINFSDKETSEKIAMCTSEAKGVESIKFESYRDYSNVGSLFGTQIGVFQQN
jgi:hypothetical protein